MKIFVLVAAAAMALASCQKPEIENVQPQEYEYTFLIGNADTKATVGETCVEWEAGDQMGVYTKVAAGTISNNAYGDITPGEPATMKVYSNQALAIGDYIYAYYPYNSTNQNGNLLVTMEIPAEQDGKDDMPMVAIPHCVESALGNGQQDAPAGKIKFANLGSVIEFNVYTETDAYAAEVVKSVTFDADNALAGKFTFDLTKVNYSDESTLSISDLTETTVVANASDLAVGTKDAPAVVKMVVAPGTYAGSIIVKTDAATYTFPISTAKEFKRSVVKPLGLKLRDDVREENTSKEVTISFATTDQRVSQDENQQKWSNEGVVFINDKTSESNAVVGNVDPVRLYKNSTITISAPGNISKIEFICDNATYATALNNSIEGSSMSTTVVTVESSSNSVTYTLSGGQVRLNSITVTYTPAGEDVTLIPELSVTTSEVEVPAAGGNAEIKYKVFNPKDGVSVVASANADWISKFTYSDGIVGFTVGENTTEQSREAEVTLSYEGAESVTAIVVQAAKATENAAYYEKVTSAPTDWSGTYLVVFESINACWDGSLLCGTSTGQLGHTAGSKYIAINDGKIEYNDSYFVIEKSGTAYTITSAYGDVIGMSTNNNGLKSGDYTNNITINNDNTVNIVSSDGYTQVAYNASAKYIRFYKTTTVSSNNYPKPCLYKLIDGNSDGEGSGTPDPTPDPEEPDPTPTPVELIMSEVTCSGQTENSLTFTWTGVEGATAYQVYFDSEDKGQITELTYTASELEAGTSHTIAVKAVGDNVNYTTSSTAKTCTASTKTAQGEGGGDSQVLTKKISFSAYAAGTQYAQGETHDLEDGFTLTINGGHLNTQVRLYDGSNATVQSPGVIQKLDVTAGNKAGTLTVYGSTNGEDWTEVQKISTTTSYIKYSVDMSSGNYTWVKFASSGAQIRLSLLDVTYQN